MRIPIEARFKRTEIIPVDPGNEEHSKYYAEGEAYFAKNYYEYGFYFNPLPGSEYSKEQVKTGSVSSDKQPVVAETIASRSVQFAEIAIDRGDYFEMAVDYLSNVEVTNRNMRNYISKLYEG